MIYETFTGDIVIDAFMDFSLVIVVLNSFSTNLNSVNWISPSPFWSKRFMAD